MSTEQIAAEILAPVTQMDAQAPVQAILDQKTETKVEAPAAEVKPTEDPRFAEKFAALTKKEREIFQKELRMKEMEQRLRRFEELERLKSENPYAFIKETGVDLEKTLLAAAREGEPPTVDDKVSELQSQIQKLQEMLKTKEETEIKTKEQMAMEQFKSNLKNHITSKADDYELILANDAVDTVFDVIQTHFEKTKQDLGEGEILPFDKAAELVENYLLEKTKKAIQAKKISQLLQAQQPAPEPQQKGFSNTISQSLTPTLTKQTAGKMDPPEVAIRRIAEQFKQKTI
jgi:hypothetical protein